MPALALFMRRDATDYNVPVNSCAVLETLFPHLAGLEVLGVESRADELVIRARTRTEQSTCWNCGEPSWRVHSRYGRRLQDGAVAGRPLTVVLQVKRFFCDNEVCDKTTFVEQIEGLTVRFGRMSAGLRWMLTAMGLALGGRAASRLAEHLAIPSSRGGRRRQRPDLALQFRRRRRPRQPRQDAQATDVWKGPGSLCCASGSSTPTEPRRSRS